MVMGGGASLGNKCDMEDKRQVSKDRGEVVSISWEWGQVP